MARDTARRAYSKNTSLRSANIGKAIGRSRQTVDSYIADLRAATQLGLNIKIFCMHRLGIPQDRISKRLGPNQASINNHLLKTPALANLINSDLSRRFTWNGDFPLLSWCGFDPIVADFFYKSLLITKSRCCIKDAISKA